MERYIYRQESTIQEPAENPIKGMLFDRENGRYNPLDTMQSDLVLDAIEGRIDAIKHIAQDRPFRVSIDLKTLEGNVKKIELAGQSPPNVLSAPIYAYFEISPRCNLSCRDCYQGKRPTVDSLKDDEIKALITRYSELGIFVVRFTGKEPTVHPRLLEFITEGATAGLRMALNTNGVFDDNFRHDLIDSGIEEIVVSLDGDEAWNDYVRGNGVYKVATRNIRELVKAGIDTRINMTVSKSNVNLIEDVAKFAHSCGSYVSYAPMRGLGNAAERMMGELLSAEDMKQVAYLVTSLRAKYAPTRLLTWYDIVAEVSDYYHQLFQITPCHARKNIFMDNEGNVYPCDHLVNLGDTFKGGNIRKEDLLVIWRYGVGLNKYRDLKHNQGCVLCKHLGSRCHGGCPSEHLVNSRDKNLDTVEDRLCFYNDRNGICAS